MTCPNCDLPPGPLTTFTRGYQLCNYCRASLARRGLSWCTRGRHTVAALFGTRSWCTACERQRNAQYAEKRRAGVRAWKAAHPERVRASQERRRDASAAAKRAKYHANPEPYRAASRAAYARASDAKRAGWRARYWSDPAKYRAASRATYTRRKLRVLWGNG